MRRNFNGATPPEKRFWSGVEKTADCWLWLGQVRNGYGRMRLNGKLISVHRFAYELLVGPIPDGLTLDHLCRNRSCVNPDHLEPVTMTVNCLRGESFAARNARQTHCRHGHEFTAQNTYRRPGHSNRYCRKCLTRRSTEYRRNRQEARAAGVAF
jgi:hypothetical protein